MNDTNLYPHQHCLLFVPSHNDSLSVKNECILSFCVENFFIASSLTSKAVDFTTLSFITVVVRLLWKAIRISSNHGWIPSCCHIKALLASIADLKNKNYDKRFSFLVLPIQKNSLWIFYFCLFSYIPTAGTWNTFITMTLHCPVWKIGIPLNALSVEIRTTSIGVKSKMLRNSKLRALSKRN